MKYAKHSIQFLLFFILCNAAQAQVPVIKEPHHKPVLVNDYVRLLDVHLNAGDTTQYHIHAAPSVIVMISKSVIGMQKLGEAPSVPSQVLPGQTSFIAYDKNPVTHRVYNSGDNVFHVMDIELAKQAPSADSCAGLQQKNIETTINEKLVRVYKFDLNNQKSVNISKNNCAHLLICISGEIKVTGKTIKTGAYIFFGPETDVSISNHQNNNTTCVLLELK